MGEVFEIAPKFLMAALGFILVLYSSTMSSSTEGIQPNVSEQLVALIGLPQQSARSFGFPGA